MANIRDIVDNLGVAYVGSEHKHGRPGWIQVDCPWCGAGTGKYHLGISLSTGAAACWRCGRKNTAKVLAILSGKAAPNIRDMIDGAVLTAAPVRKTGKLVLPRGVAPMLPGHITYLQRRRGLVAANVAATWGVAGIGQTARLAWRLFIPVHHHGEVVSWVTRSIKPNDHQRYISAAPEEEAISQKTILYGADYARHTIIIHEGPIDVWATGPGAVATLGTAYTEAQLLAMAKYPVRVVCYDTGHAAQARARELANALSVFPGSTYNVVLETGKDTAEAEKGEVAALRNKFLKHVY